MNETILLRSSMLEKSSHRYSRDDTGPIEFIGLITLEDIIEEILQVQIKMFIYLSVLLFRPRLKSSMRAIQFWTMRIVSSVEHPTYDCYQLFESAVSQIFRDSPNFSVWKVPQVVFRSIKYESSNGGCAITSKSLTISISIL